ncbi:P-loop containing nucleoside triphosphate hydrolase protein [Pisolithus albus]|nr:P-loop containing nucleoside triphosphate hydrolase protein [Pisolithus albus]
MVPSPTGIHLPRALPSLTNIRTHTQRVFGVRPCLWQLRVAETILKGEKDVMCVVGTGMGKTLTFWMPLLFRPDGMQIVITPLNLLGQQNVASLAKAGIHAISVSCETASPVNFQAIGAFRYRVIVISPEQILRPGGGFEKLLKSPLFVSRIISIVIDEAHCLTDWGEFRPEYRELGRLRYVLPRSVPLLVTSATITKAMDRDITHLLHMCPSRTVTVRRSSDRPNIKIGVKKIKYALNSFADLTFLIPPGLQVDDPPPPKFLIFFDDIADSINAACVLCRRLPSELKEKIRWFNADMSTMYKEEELGRLISGETWGLCTTTSFGMGMDVPDILMVIQWRATCNLAALWQRFGRAARDRRLTGTALLFAEKEYFNDEKVAKAARKAKREETRKRTAREANLPGEGRPLKRTALASYNGKARYSPAGTQHDGLVTADGGLSDGESEGEESRPAVMDADGPGAKGVDVLLGMLARGEEISGQILHAGKRRRRNLDLGLDLLINAKEQSGGGCRRTVFNVCFDNATAGGKFFGF